MVLIAQQLFWQRCTNTTRQGITHHDRDGAISVGAIHGVGWLDVQGGTERTDVQLSLNEFAPWSVSTPLPPPASSASPRTRRAATSAARQVGLRTSLPPPCLRSHSNSGGGGEPHGFSTAGRQTFGAAGALCRPPHTGWRALH